MKKLAFIATSALLMASAASAQMLVIGNDEKVTWNDAGAPVFLPPGKDSVTLVDIGTDPANPKIVANLPLMNSVFGPPTNLAIAPDESIALVANSMDWQDDAGKWKPVPDDKLYVIDMKANPAALINTVKVGKQPSGLSINKAGTMALVANRADNSISVLSIKGKEVALIDTVAMGDSVASVVFSPDGKRALAAKFPQHKIAVLEIDGMKVTYNKVDMPVGLWPYNLNITPDGKWLYIGHYVQRTLSILKVDGTKVTDTGKTLALPGQPASLRSRVQ